MRKVKKTILLVFGGIVFLMLLSYIDYWVAYKNGNAPVLSIKKEYKDKQMETYRGLFYTMWVCTAEEDNYGFDKMPDGCPLKLEFTDEYYTNTYGIKISKEN